MFSRLNSSPDEVSRASELASAFLAYRFPGRGDYVTWEQFKAYCLECVSISRVFSYQYRLTYSRLAFCIYSLLQLWVTIFTLPTAPQAPRAGGKSTLLISTTNILFFLNVAQFLSGKLPDYRFNQNESLFQLDLQPPLW
jgi:hypothetical protein